MEGGAGAGAIQVVPFSGANFVPAIAARPSVNNSIFNCGDLLFFNQGGLAAVDICSPVVMNFSPVPVQAEFAHAE